MSSKSELPKKEKATQQKSNSEVNSKSKVPFLDALENFLQKYEWILFGCILVLGTYFGFQLFDLRISVLGDDSAYILRASEWIKKGVFPSFQGPLLPLILGKIIATKGIDLTSLKMVSFISMIGSIPLLFLAFRKKIPYTINFIILAIYSWNASMLYYASQTFSEALYLFVQALCLFLFLQLVISKKNVSPIKDSWRYLLYAASLVLLYMTRSVGLSLLIASVVYFILKLEWKQLGMLIIAFALMYAPFHFYKSQFKEDKGGTSQFEMLMQKDVYDASKGKEDVSGFVKRFTDNSVIYLGKNLPWMLGWSSPPEVQTQEPVQGNPLLTLLIFGSSIVCLYLGFRYKEDSILFLVLYGGAFLSIVFIVLQTSWDQDRLILTAIPLILLSILCALYLLSKYPKPNNWVQISGIIAGVICIFLNLSLTFKKIEEFAPIKEMNAQGDMLYGYPPEWRNYLEMCQYIGKNFKENQKAVVRKPEMAFIYSNGKEFHGYYRSPEPGTTADSVLNQLDRLGVQYIVQDQIFGTMSNYLQLIGTTYPTRLKLVYQVGQDRPAALYEILPR